MTTKPTLWFAGTPSFAATALQALIESEQYTITGVLTQPDRPAGRGRKLQPSAVKTLALAHGLPLSQPEKLRADIALFTDQVPPDIMVVAAYGLLLPQWVLEYPRLGCLNIHASLLPRWRGAAPIQRAIIAGDAQTGISIMQMDKGLDTGAVWLKKSLEIGEQSAAVLHDALAKLGAEALLEALPIVFAQTHSPIAQDNALATYADKLSKAEARIDWQQDSFCIARLIRGYNPSPVAHTQLNGETLRLYQATPFNTEHTAPVGTVLAHDKDGLMIACGKGSLRVTELQLPNKNRTSAGSLRNSRDLTGALLQ